MDEKKSQIDRNRYNKKNINITGKVKSQVIEFYDP